MRPAAAKLLRSGWVNLAGKGSNLLRIRRRRATLGVSGDGFRRRLNREG